MSNPTGVLAAFAADLDPESIPEVVTTAAKQLLLDALASALIGWSSVESSHVLAAAKTTMGVGNTTVIGRSPLSPAAATLVNAYLITARSFCDVHRPTLCHVTPVVVPAALTAAERAGAGGSTLLAGLVVGMETLLRIGRALRYSEFRRRGWHTPGVAGPLGAAAAVSRIEGLDATTTRNALGLAGTQASGTFASLGSPAIKFHQARAATAGLVSADLAATGFRAADNILTAADGGLLGTYSDGGDPDLLTEHLGAQWHLAEISTRRWPAAAALQSLIAAILDSSIDADDVASIRIGLPPDAYEMNAAVEWDTPFTAALSTRWVAAVVLQDRACWLEQFAAERLSDAATAGLADRVVVTDDPGLEEGGVDLTISLRDGSEHRDRRDVADTAPMDWSATADKMRRAAKGVIPADSARKIIAMIAELEQVDDVATLTHLLETSATR